MPIESMVLNMKCMGIGAVLRFPFPSPPPPRSVVAALRQLVHLGALKAVGKHLQHLLGESAEQRQARVDKFRSTSGNAVLDSVKVDGDEPDDSEHGSDSDDEEAAGLGEQERITGLGTVLSHLPVHPRYGKMLVLSRDLPCSAHVIAIVAGLTVEQPFIIPRVPRDLKEASKSTLASGGGAKGGDGAAAGDDDELEEDDMADDEQAQELLEQMGGEDAEAARGTSESLANEREKRRLERVKEELQAQVQAARDAHGAMKDKTSDALTLLNVITAYSEVCAEAARDASTDPSLHNLIPSVRKRRLTAIVRKRALVWCKQNFIREKALREMNQLRQQLHSILHAADTEGWLHPDEEQPLETRAPRQAGKATAGDILTGSLDAEEATGGQRLALGDVDHDVPDIDDDGSKSDDAGAEGVFQPQPFSLTLPPASAELRGMIRQVLATGLLDRVAKRASPEVTAALQMVGKCAPRQVAYIPCLETVEAPIFVHLQSSIHDQRKRKVCNTHHDMVA